MFPPVAATSNSNAIRRRCEWGLVATLRATRPDAALNHNGYVLDPQHNLLDDIALDDFRHAFESGAGQELGSVRDGHYVAGKFCAAYSSSALAANHFAPFAKRALPVLGSGRFLHLVGFEAPFPTGLRGIPPHLDALISSETRRFAVESKCLEYLRAKSTSARKKSADRLKDKYLNGITDDRRTGPWFAELEKQATEPSRYRHLDAAQLIKHALGLLNAPAEQPTTLLYLYWEPRDAHLSPVFAGHREEIAAFANRVAGGELRFEAMSYPELWDQWRANGDPYLAAHVTALRRRYDIAAFSS